MLCGSDRFCAFSWAGELGRSEADRLFITTAETSVLYVAKRSGATEPFSRAKVVSGVRKACEKRPVKIEDLERACDEIASELEQEGYKEIPSSVIGAKVMRRLEAIDHVAYVRYASVYRQFEDVGEFINEIKSLGTHRLLDDEQDRKSVV
mgnify:CR=1 FL=1